MTTKRAGIQKYMVRHTEPFEEDSVVAGVMAIDAEQRVEVISSEEQFADEMELAADMLNDTDEFMLRISPPAGASPRATFKRAVPRDAPDARDAVLELLRAEYGFELTPAP